MNFTNRICQTLHEEHQANIALLDRVEGLIARQRRVPPNIADPSVARLISDLATDMAAEVERHFDFEERQLFAYLEARGDNAIGVHLTDEHSIIRPLIIRLAEIARGAVARGFDEASWNEFRRLGAELCQRLLAHIHKEEAALLPLIEDNMDSETEVRLHEEYLGNA